MKSFNQGQTVSAMKTQLLIIIIIFFTFIFLAEGHADANDDLFNAAWQCNFSKVHDALKEGEQKQPYQILTGILPL
jgi:hypothetical protein